MAPRTFERTIPRYDLNKINTIAHCDELFPTSYEMPIISSVYPLQKKQISFQTSSSSFGDATLARSCSSS